jgi:hypothetical protein
MTLTALLFLMGFIAGLGRLWPWFDRLMDALLWRYLMLLWLPFAVVLYCAWWNLTEPPEWRVTLRGAGAEIWAYYVRRFWKGERSE